MRHEEALRQASNMRKKFEFKERKNTKSQFNEKKETKSELRKKTRSEFRSNRSEPPCFKP